MSEAITDWIYLPAYATSLSLWECLHDAEMKEIHSDLLARTLTLSFQTFLSDYHHLPKNTFFHFHFEEVQSVRALSYAIWPGEFSMPSHALPKEQMELSKDYQSKWREQSVSWELLEELLREEEAFIDVKAAELARSKGSVALKWEGNLVGHSEIDSYYHMAIRAGQLTVSDSKNKMYTIEEFLQLGQTYWEDFSRRKEL